MYQARSKKLAGEHCMALYHWRVFWLVVILEHKVVVLFFHQGVRMLCICSLHVIAQRKSTMYRTKWEDQWHPKHWLIGVSDHWGIHYTGRATAIPWRYRILRDGPYGWVVFMVGAIGGDLRLGILEGGSRGRSSPAGRSQARPHHWPPDPGQAFPRCRSPQHARPPGL
jgi:hypothetical protein